MTPFVSVGCKQWYYYLKLEASQKGRQNEQAHIVIVIHWEPRNYGSKQPIPRAQPEGEVCVRSHNSLQLATNESLLYLLLIA